MKRIISALVIVSAVLIPRYSHAISGTVESSYIGSPITVSSSAKSLNGTVGQYFSASFQAAGGTPVYKWQVDGLPTGLSFATQVDAFADCAQPADGQPNCGGGYTSGINGAVFGTPIQAGTFTAKFAVTDANSRKTVVDFVFTIQSSGADSNHGITITAPQGGEVWQVGTSHAISWYDQTGSSMARNVNITLEPYIACLYSTPPCAVQQIAPYAIATNITSNGNFTWAVPTDIASRYITAVRIMVSTTDGSLYGTSGVFSISGTSISTKVRTGYVDTTSATRVEGWAYDETAQSTCVTVTYESVDTGLTLANGAKAAIAQQACPSVNRPDAETWLRSNYGNARTISQPLGFVANPSAAISTPGTYRVKSVTLSNSGVALGFSNSAAQQTFVISGIGSALVVNANSALTGVVGQNVQTSFSVTGGATPYSWSVQSGSLPDGLSLIFPQFNCFTTPCIAPKDQVIVGGTPTKAGVFTFVLYVTDSSGRSGQGSFTFVVADTNTSRNITVTKPIAGDIWLPGKTYTIVWTPSTTGSSVTIELTRYIACLHNPVYVCAIAQPAPYTIAINIADTGSFTWTVPGDITASVSGSATIQVTNAAGQSGESGVITVGSGTSDVAIAPGMLVQPSGSGTVYYITPNIQKYGFVSFADFTGKGFRFDQVRKVDVTSLSTLSETKVFTRAGNVSFKYRTGAAVYYLTTSRCKEVYPSLTTLRAWNVRISDIYIIPSSEQYTDCAPNYVQLPNETLVKTRTDNTVYVVRNRQVQAFASLSAFVSYIGKPILVISTGELSLYPKGPIIQ